MKTKIVLSVLVLFAVSCLLSAVSCLAAVPSLLNYQGVLKDSSGVPQNGNFSMRFSIYDDSIGGNKLWEEIYMAVEVKHGLFNVLLGSSSDKGAIPDSVFASPNAWLEVQVFGNVLTPRRRIVSVGYALHSEFTDTAEYARFAPDLDWQIDTSGFNIYRMTGNVGIGTASPAARLEISEDLYGVGGKAIRVTNTNPDGYEGFVLEAFHDGVRRVAIQPRTIALFDETGSGTVTITGGQPTIFRDNVGIGVTGPTRSLHVSGTVRLEGISGGPGTTVLADVHGVLNTATASKRYKENIRRLEIDPEKVLQLQPVKFEWKTSGEEDIGLIAEDVATIIPDLVVIDKERKPDAVKYDKVTIYLLEMIKAQQAKILSLEKQMEELQVRLGQ